MMHTNHSAGAPRYRVRAASKRWLRRNWLLIGLFAALVLGSLLGADAQRLNPGGRTNTAVVIGLFLITGLTLPTNRIARDLANPRLHIAIQAFIFGVFPLYFLTAVPLFGGLLDGQIVVGFLALAVLPTTVSSCTVFTHAAGGNTVASVFNSAVANVAGIFLSPLLLSVLLAGTQRSLPVAELVAILRNLALNMLVPILGGQLLRVVLHTWVDAHRSLISTVMNALILVIVTLAFAQTAANPQLAAHAGLFVVPLVYLAVSHLLLVGLAYLVSGLARFSPPDRIAMVFVAPQKTLALGAPLLTVYFAGQDVLGVALLPLIFYHSWQLIVAGALRSLPLLRRAQAQQR